MPFKCDQCEQVCSRKYSLTRHKIRLHSGVLNKKRKHPNDNAPESFQPSLKQAKASSLDKHNTESTSVSDSSLQTEDATNMSEQSVFNDQASAILNDENAPDQQFIVEPQQKDDEKYEQQQCNAFQVEDSVSKDFLTKQQHVLETIQQSILDLKQETMRSKIEKQHDLELLKQSLFDLKQSVTRDESAHPEDMVGTNDNFESKEHPVSQKTQQSCLVKDGVKKKVIEYKRNADEEKLLQILRDHDYPTDESSDEEEPIDWTAPL